MLSRPLALVTNYLCLVQQEDKALSSLLNGHLDNLKKRFGYVLTLLFDQWVVGNLEFFPPDAEGACIPNCAADGFFDSLDSREAQFGVMGDVQESADHLILPVVPGLKLKNGACPAVPLGNGLELVQEDRLSDPSEPRQAHVGRLLGGGTKR